MKQQLPVSFVLPPLICLSTGMKTSTKPQSVKESRKRMCIIFSANCNYIVFLLYRQGFADILPTRKKIVFFCLDAYDVINVFHILKWSHIILFVETSKSTRKYKLLLVWHKCDLFGTSVFLSLTMTYAHHIMTAQQITVITYLIVEIRPKKE